MHVRILMHDSEMLIDVSLANRSIGADATGEGLLSRVYHIVSRKCLLGGQLQEADGAHKRLSLRLHTLQVDLRHGYRGLWQALGAGERMVECQRGKTAVIP